MEHQRAHTQANSYGNLNGPEKKNPILYQKYRVNLKAVAIGIFVPWVVFTIVMALACFYVHYAYPALLWFFIVVFILLDFCCMYLAYVALRKKWSGESVRTPTWYVFLALSMALAIVTGVSFGYVNYWVNTEPYYDLSDMASYSDIDPSSVSGQSMIDVGQVTFSSGTYVDTSSFISFTNLDQYCVAPIINENVTGKYDYWAAGLNCCSSTFTCGDASSSSARSGLRIVKMGLLRFYQLGVQQASSTYHVSAPSPLFFYWVEDPSTELDSYHSDGLKDFYLASFSFFGLLLFLAVVTIMVVQTRRL